MKMMMTEQVHQPDDRTRLIAIGAALLGAVVIANVVGLLLGPEGRVDSGDVVFLTVVVGIAVLIWAAVLWAARTPDHANRAAVAGVVTGVVGVLANAVFWTGLPLVLGGGAVLLGRRATTRADHGAGRARLARATPVLGWLAIALWAVAYFVVQDFFPPLLDALS